MSSNAASEAARKAESQATSGADTVLDAQVSSPLPSSQSREDDATSQSQSSARQGRRLGRDALIYGLGMILSRAASLIMLPIYTRLLTPADYGILQILDMTSDVVAILVSAGCTAGVMRFYFKADTEHERRAVIGSAMALQIGLNAIGSLVLLAFAQPIWVHALHSTHSIWLVYLAAANFTLGSLAVVPLILMQIEKRALLFSMVSLVRLVLQLSGNILFLVVLRRGPEGILLSSFVVNILVGSLAIFWLLRHNGFRVSKKALVDLRRFGIPIQIATLGTFIVTFGDRIFLDKYSGLATVGLYGLAYQFGFILDQVGIAPYMRAWTPRRFEFAREPRAERDAKNSAGFRHLNIVMFTAAVGIAILAHPTLRILSDREYWEAADIVPIILAAYIVQGWVNVVEISIDLSEKTKYVSLSVWMSVLAVLVGYFVLIPMYGGYGAAIATLIAFVVRLGFHWHYSQRLWPMGYGWAKIFRLAAYAVIAALFAMFFRPHSLFLELAVAAATLLGYAILVWTTIVSSGERQEVLRFVTGKLQLLRLRGASAA